MPDNTADQTRESLKRRAAKKILVPLAASATSAAAGYVARKAPQLLEEKILPKIREAGGVGAFSQQLWSEVTAKIPHVPQQARDLRARITDGGGTDDRQPSRAATHGEREQARREREAHRRERRKAASTS
jgi:hypothetical protein